MSNLELTRKKDVSSFRKISLGTWRNAYDPSVYGSLEVRMDEALRYLAEFREKTGKKLTVSHLVARAIAEVFKKVPDANAILRWNRIYLRKRIGVFLQVAMTDEGDGKVDLSGITLYDVEKKSLYELIGEFETKVDLVRKRKDPALEKTRKTFLGVPYFLLGPLLRLISFLSYTLNLDLRSVGIPQDPFGSVMVTNIGSLGLDTAYVPLVPYSRVPILIAVGAVKEVPIVDAGVVRPGKTMSLHATFDHRFIDGFHASVMSKTMRAWLEHPYDHFDKIADLPAAATAAATATSDPASASAAAATAPTPPAA